MKLKQSTPVAQKESSRTFSMRGTLLRQLNSAVIRMQPKYCDKDHTGTDAFMPLFVKNLLRPERLFNKIAYGQMFPLPQAWCRAEKYEKPAEVSTQASLWTEQLRRDGMVILPGLFRGEIAGLAERYGAVAGKHQGTKELMARFISLMDPAFDKIVLNEQVLQAFAGVFGYQPFLQDIPVITITDTLNKACLDSQNEIVKEWHCDDINTLKMLVFLTDIRPEDTHMKIAKGSHRTLRFPDAVYTDQSVRPRYEIINCTGPAGTAVLFNSNALHRQWRQPQSFRVMLAAKFSPGNGLNFKKKFDDGHFELQRAGMFLRSTPRSPLQTASLKGVFMERL